MNELYTLMQCAFGMMSKQAFGTHSLFFNDDAVYELSKKLEDSSCTNLISNKILWING